jgi:hypothetical protein
MVEKRREPYSCEVIWLVVFVYVVLLARSISFLPSAAPFGRSLLPSERALLSQCASKFVSTPQRDHCTRGKSSKSRPQVKTPQVEFRPSPATSLKNLEDLQASGPLPALGRDGKRVKRTVSPTAHRRLPQFLPLRDSTTLIDASRGGRSMVGALLHEVPYEKAHHHCCVRIDVGRTTALRSSGSALCEWMDDLSASSSCASRRPGSQRLS